jgi:hypothetical protein
MAYIGKVPAAVALTSSDITDGIVSTAKIAADAITEAKIADNAVTEAKTAWNDVPFRNILINGDMSIAQRGTSTSSVTSTGYYTCDRWNWQTDYGTVTLSQDTDVPTGQGFAKSFKADVTTAGTVSSGGTIKLRQNMEGQMLQHLKKGTSSAESITISFWIKSTKTGTYICELYDPGNTRQISKSYTVDSTNTWEKKTLTFAGDTSGAFTNDNASRLQVIWYISAGSDYTSGTLSTSWTSSTNANRAVGQVDAQDSTSNNIYFTGVQMEIGSSASDFEFVPYDVNLARCQRYYEKSYSDGTNPGTATSLSSVLGGGTVAAASTSYLSTTAFFKISKRGIPTITLYDAAGTSGKVSADTPGTGSSNTQTGSAGSVGLNSFHGFRTSGDSRTNCNFQYTASAEL